MSNSDQKNLYPILSFSKICIVVLAKSHLTSLAIINILKQFQIIFFLACPCFPKNGVCDDESGSCTCIDEWVTLNVSTTFGSQCQGKI